MAVECSAALPDDRDHDDTDENFSEADGVPNAFDRPHQKFREERHKGGSESRMIRLAARP